MEDVNHQCYLNKQRVQALWDTVSQVCASDELWKANHLPDVPLRDGAELIHQLDPLQTEAIKGAEMLYVGWL